MAISGTSANDVRDGTAGDDLFRLQQGGDDIVTGDGGNDTFMMRGALTAADSIDGGGDTDTVVLQGDYSAGLVFGASTMTNVELLRLTGAFDYDLTLNDANVAAHRILIVNAGSLDAGHSLSFDGSAELDGRLAVFGGAGGDDAVGGRRNDQFVLHKGGDDAAYGGRGHDYFYMGAALTAADIIDGGLGADELALDGAYGAAGAGNAFTLSGAFATSMETLEFDDGHDYYLAASDSFVPAGHVLTVEGDSLTINDTLQFDGSAESDGAFDILAGAGDDMIVGGAMADTIDLSEGGANTATGGGASDDITCGGGVDTIAFAAVSDSTSVNYDVIHGLDADSDVFDVTILIDTVNATTGGVDSANFDDDMGTVINDFVSAGRACIVTVDGGDLFGHTFLAVDGDGSGDYEGGLDFIFDITGYTGTIDPNDFI